MSIRDLLAFAWEALRVHKVRTRLTAAALAVGVASVLLLVGLGEGARRWVVSRFEALGAGVLVVLPGKTETRGGVPMAPSTTRDLTLADAREVGRRVPGVRRVIPIVLGEVMARADARGRASTVIGTTPDFLAIRDLSVRSGSNLPEIEEERAAPVCVIGRRIQRDLFPDGRALGRWIRLGEYRYRVIGTLAEEGQRMMVDLDDVILIPVASGLRIFNRRGLFRLIVQLNSPGELERTERKLIALLKERHRDEEDFTVLSPGAVAASLDGVIAILTTALAAIAAVSLSVAGIGVMNVMLISVGERRPEVGLMKALGAGSRQVAAVFLAEAFTISVLGGLAGLAGGFGLVLAARRLYPDIPFRIDPVWALAAFGTVTVVGLAFGTLPAVRAMRLDPVEALRGRR